MRNEIFLCSSAAYYLSEYVLLMATMLERHLWRAHRLNVYRTGPGITRLKVAKSTTLAYAAMSKSWLGDHCQAGLISGRVLGWIVRCHNSVRILICSTMKSTFSHSSTKSTGWTPVPGKASLVTLERCHGNMGHQMVSTMSLQCRVHPELTCLNITRL